MAHLALPNRFGQKLCCELPFLPSKHRVVACGSHQDSNGIGQPGIHARGQEGHARSSLSGIGVPFSELGLVQAMSRFCTRQTTPQTLSSIIQPNPL